MEISLSDYITTKYKDFAEKPEETLKVKGKDYNKDWARAVKYFVDRINVDRRKEKKPPVTFMQVRMKLIAVKEIDDLRIFYKKCCDYKYKKRGNTFSKCFWGSLKITK